MIEFNQSYAPLNVKLKSLPKLELAVKLVGGSVSSTGVGSSVGSVGGVVGSVSEIFTVAV